ncbi:MAG: ribosomal RNA small subunit methyltransferase A, partial [Acidimicrobiales bacterium]
MARQRRTERDWKRRSLGQNFLVDQHLAHRLVTDLGLVPGDLVVEIGAGTGALTVPLAATGADVLAIEIDHRWAEQLRDRIGRIESQRRVRIIETDLRRLRLPKRPYRVVANTPFGSTTELLSRLLDDPGRGPTRADLIVQREVAIKHTTVPPVALRTAAWNPWW